MFDPIGVLDVIESQIGQAAQQGCNRNLRLNASELGADAVVNTAAERKRADVASADVEPIRVRIDLRVAIGRAEQTDRLALFKRDAADFIDVFKRRAAGQLD